MQNTQPQPRQTKMTSGITDSVLEHIDTFIEGLSLTIGATIIGNTNKKDLKYVATAIKTGNNVFDKIVNGLIGEKNSIKAVLESVSSKSSSGNQLRVKLPQTLISNIDNMAKMLNGTEVSIFSRFNELVDKVNEINGTFSGATSDKDARNVIKIIVKGINAKNVNALSKLAEIKLDKDGLNENTVTSLLTALKLLKEGLDGYKEPIDIDAFINSLDKLSKDLTKFIDNTTSFDESQIEKFTSLETIAKTTQSIVNAYNDMASTFVSTNDIIEALTNINDVNTKISKVNINDIEKNLSKFNDIIDTLSSIDVSKLTGLQSESLNTAVMASNLIGIANIAVTISNIDMYAAQEGICNLTDLIYSDSNNIPSFKNVFDALSNLKGSFNKDDIKTLSGVMYIISDFNQIIIETAAIDKVIDNTIDVLDVLLKVIIPKYEEVINKITSSSLIGSISNLGEYKEGKDVKIHFEELRYVFGVFSDIKNINEVLVDNLIPALLSSITINAMINELPLLQALLEQIADLKIDDKSYEKLEHSLKNVKETFSHLTKIETSAIVCGLLVPGAIVGLKLIKVFLKQLSGNVLKTIIAKDTRQQVKEATKAVDPKNTDTTDNEGNYATLIITCAGLLLFGALVGGFVGRHIKNIIVFTGTLTLFVFSVLAVWKLVGPETKGAADAATTVTSLIRTSAAVMFIGALALMIMPKLALYSIAFALTLSVFIFTVVGTYMLVSSLTKKVKKTADEISRIITISALLMITGALIFMLQPKLIIWAFVFTLTLGMFVTGLLATYVLFSIFARPVRKFASDLMDLVIASALVMLTGALLFMLKPQLLVWTFVFTLMLSMFISKVISAYTDHTKGLFLVGKHVKQLSWLVAISATIMLVGAFIFMLKPQLLVWTAVFTLCLYGFIRGIIHAYKQLGKDDVAVSVWLGSKVLKSVAYSIGYMGIALWITRKAVGNSPSKTLVAIGVLAIAAMGFAYLFKILGGGGFGIKGGAKTGTLLDIIIGRMPMDNMELPMRIKIGANVAKSMAYAIGLFGIALCIVNKTVDEPELLIYKVGALGLIAVGLAGFFRLLGWVDKGGNVKKGAITAMLMGGALALLGIAFSIIHTMFEKGNPLLDVLALSAVTAVAGLFFLALCAMGTTVAWGALTALAMGGALALLSIGFLLVHKCVTETDPSEDFLLLSRAIIVAGGVFALLGLLSIAIIPGSIAAALMSGALVLLGGAFAVLHKMVSGGMDPKTDFTKLNDAMPIVRGFFESISGSIKTFFKAMVSAGFMLVSALAINKALITINNISTVFDSNIQKRLSTLKTVLFGDNNNNENSFKGFVGILDELSSAKNVWIYTTAAASALLLCAAVKEVKYIAKTIAKACIYIDKVDVKLLQRLSGNKKNKDSINIIDAFFNVLPEDFNLAKSAKIILKTGLVNATMLPICALIGRMSTTIGDVANLKIPIEWNQLGIATNYRQLSAADFAMVGVSVASIVNTLGNAIINAYDTAQDKTIFDKGSWFGGKSKFSKVVCAMKDLGPLIATMAQAVGDMALLQVPIEWDKNGKAIEFRQLNKSDFKNAADSVSTIVSTLGIGLWETYNKNPWLFRGGEDSIISKVSKSASSMGELISNIAQGVANYASGTIPIAWDKDGKPIDFENITPEKYTEATATITELISVMGEGIMGLYDVHDDWFEDGLFTKVANAFTSKGGENEKNPFVRVASTCAVLGTLIKNISDGVIAYASGKIPIHWNKDGKPDDFISLGPQHFDSACASIQTVITMLGNALMATYNDPNNAKFFATTDKGKTLLEEVMAAITPMGNLIKNISDGVLTFAAGTIPIAWDKDGKAIKFRHMGEKDFKNAATFISDVISVLGDSIITWAKKPETSELITNGLLEKALKITSNIGNTIGGIAKGVSAYYEMGIPIYKDGKMVEKKVLPKDWMKVVPENIEAIVTNMGKSLDKIMKSHTKWSNTEHWRPINTAIKHITGAISTVSSAVQKVAELKMPTGYDKDGNATGYIAIDSTHLGANGKVAKTINAMFEAIVAPFYTGEGQESDIVKAAINFSQYGQNSIFTKITNMISGMNKSISNASNLIYNFMNKKLPVEIDEKTGKVTKWELLNNKGDFSFFQKNITDILTLIPNTVNNIITLPMFNEDIEAIQAKITSATAFNMTGQIFLVNMLKSINKITGLLFTKNIQTLINSARIEEEKDKENQYKFKIISGIADFTIGYYNMIKNVSAHISSIMSEGTDYASMYATFDGFSKNLMNIVQAADAASNAGTDGFDNISTGLIKLNDTFTKIDDKNLKKFGNEAATMGKLVKNVNAINQVKLNSIIRLASEMNKLTLKFGNLDNLTTAITKNLSETLNNLADKIIVAKQTIEKTEKIQKTRHDKIKDSISAIKELMETPLNVTVKSEQTTTPNPTSNGDTQQNTPAEGESGGGYDVAANASYPENTPRKQDTRTNTDKNRNNVNNDYLTKSLIKALSSVTLTVRNK